MPGKASDDAAAAAALLQKKLKLGVQFYFKTPQFSINKQSVPKEMYAHL